MKSFGPDAGLLPIAVGQDDVVRVEDEAIGHLEGFRFVVDRSAGHSEGKMLLAAADKALPRLLGARAEDLAAADLAGVVLEGGGLYWRGQEIARLHFAPGSLTPRIALARDLANLPEASRKQLGTAIERWVAARLQPLAPLASLMTAARDPAAGSQARALLLALIAGHGFTTREDAGIAHLPKEMRPFLRRIGVTFGALDIFAPALLKPAPRRALVDLGIERRPLEPAMLPVIAGRRELPAGYRRAGGQAIRIDLAEKIIHGFHDQRAAAQIGGKERPHRRFSADLALATSIGLTRDNAIRLLGQAGFRANAPRPLRDGAFGPPRPELWEWRSQSLRGPRRAEPVPPIREGGAFAALAGLVR